MVPIEDIITYQTRIRQSPKLTSFNKLLLGNFSTEYIHSDINETEEIYFGVVSAINSNNKEEFQSQYYKKKKSNPSKESPSPFVNDDFLMFCLIVGIIKFNEDKTWIKNIVSLRTKNTITITFENLLTENYFSKSNSPEIVLMFFQLNNPSLITNDFLTNTFKSISGNDSLFEDKSDFFILCSIRAYDLVITLKESLDGSEINLLKRFTTKFLKRVKLLSWLIQSILLIAVFYGGFAIVSKFPAIKEFLDKIGSVLKVLGIIGLSQIGNLFPIIRKKSFEIILSFFGYPKQLIKKAM